MLPEGAKESNSKEIKKDKSINGVVTFKIDKGEKVKKIIYNDLKNKTIININ